MAEPNEIADGGKAAAPESRSSESKAELPNVESPPLSPADKPAEAATGAQPEVKAAKEASPSRAAKPRIPPLTLPVVAIPPVKHSAPRFSRRARRRAALAATVMLAAGFGAAVGAIANRAPEQLPPQRDVALIEENEALQRSVARLTKDLAALKTGLDTAARESKAQLAKVTEKLSERIDRAIETTGSIGKPAVTQAAAPAAAEAIDPAPMPQPRPVIVQGWTVREARDGRVFVENRGELFAVAPGLPLPGLGRIEAIRREGGSLVVVTSKGLITATQTTAAVRPRPYYPPYWRPY